MLVFSFIHQTKDHEHFYIFDEEQFKGDTSFFHQCLGFAAHQSSFKVSSLSLCGLKKEQAYSPYTLSNAVTKQQRYLNPPLSDEVNNIIEKLPYAVTINDITSASQSIDYQSLGYEGIDLARLKKIGHKQEQHKKRVDEITLAFGHQRQEMRFKYITPVNIECEGINCLGKSADFSVSGLKVNLDNPALLNKGDIVYCSFPNLQKITSSFDLKLLPYKVIKINKDKNVINLRVSVKEHQHIGRSFFKLLIDKNQAKLTPDEYAMLTPGLSGALRTLYAVNMATPSVIVQSSGSRYKFEKLVVGEYSQPSRNLLLNAMQRLSDRNGYYNLYPLLGNLKLSHIFDQHIKKLLATDLAAEELIYVAINWSKKEVDQTVIIRKSSDLNTPEITNFFIKKSLKQGEFYCLQLKLSRSDEPHMPYLTPELAYISAYAIHRGKQLEQEIFSVVGLMQIIDVTQETLLRYGLKN